MAIDVAHAAGKTIPGQRLNLDRARPLERAGAVVVDDGPASPVLRFRPDDAG